MRSQTVASILVSMPLREVSISFGLRHSDRVNTSTRLQRCHCQTVQYQDAFQTVHSSSATDVPYRPIVYSARSNSVT
jgi:hypothetical protein